MAFGRRRGATLKTEKREITWTNLAQDASSAKTVGNITCVRDPTGDSEIEPGTIIRWLYAEFNVSAETITNTKVFHWIVSKNPVASLTITPTLYNADTKSWIIKRGMEMLPKDVGTVYKRIFAVSIPKKMRRASEGDIYNLKYQVSSAETINTCGFVLYNIEPA